MRGTDFVVFDIEAIPDPELVRDEDLRDPETGAERFPSPPLHKVVAIAISTFRREPDGAITFVSARAGGAADADERQLIAAFWRSMAELEPTFIGFNTRGFDIPVLAYRSMRHGLSAPFYFSAANKWENYRARYATDWHLDLADALADFGASRRVSLDTAARLVSAPGKLDTAGGDVAALYAGGQIEAIRSYCVTDTLSTGLVWLAWRRLVGDLSAEQMAATHEAMLAWLEAPERADAQLALFAQRWREARRDA